MKKFEFFLITFFLFSCINFFSSFTADKLCINPIRTTVTETFDEQRADIIDKSQLDRIEKLINVNLDEVKAIPNPDSHDLQVTIFKAVGAILGTILLGLIRIFFPFFLKGKKLSVDFSDVDEKKDIS